MNEVLTLLLKQLNFNNLSFLMGCEFHDSTSSSKKQTSCVFLKFKTKVVLVFYRSLVEMTCTTT